MSHTPAPWSVGKLGGSVVSANGVEHGPGGCDCVEYYGGHLIAESISPANAKLIAAAPDLLASLRVYVEYDEYINGPQGDPRSDRLQQARDAIAKATL